MTLVARIQAAQARQRATSLRHDTVGVFQAKAQIAALRKQVAARIAAK